jgi:Family of unknown function (DUF5522)
MSADVELIEGEDFYREGAFVVFTEGFLLRRGYCCRSGCRHCPYGYGKEDGDVEHAHAPGEEKAD